MMRKRVTTRARVWRRRATALSISLVCFIGACGGDDSSDAGLDTSPDDVIDADGAEETGTPGVDVTEDTDAVDVDAIVPDIEDVDEDAEVSPPLGPLSCTETVATEVVTPGTESSLSVPVDGGAVDLQLTFTGAEVESMSTVTLSCGGASIVDGDFVSLSPSFIVTSDAAHRFRRRYQVTIPFDRGAMPAGARPSAIRVFHRRADGAIVQPVVSNLQENMVRGIVRFETELTGTFEIGVASDAGTTYDREWQFRAITGVSMGASGASMLGMSNPELFDIIAPLGGPTDWTYLYHYIKVGGMGGFAPAPTFGRGENFTPTQEFEHAQAYDEWWFPAGEGTGGSFNRRDYSRIFLDLMMTFGNMVNYNPESPYVAAGLPLSELLRPASERCNFTEGCGTNAGVYVIESGYYDDEFNPDGSLPVITFCDGRGSTDRDRPFARACDLNNDGIPDETNQGLYDNACVQEIPIDISFAVDVNGNGIRDPGEPVIRRFHEPFDDYGSDGIPSHLEEGYDPITNPDPAGDDYDYVNNPFGTEGNWLYDEGEPYRDYGLDGVDGTPQFEDGGYDFGEGNNQFDYNPNLAHLLFQLDPRHRLIEMGPEVLDHTTFYLDAGIRDLFNFAVSGNQFVGALQGLGGNVRVYDGFYAVQDLPPNRRDRYDFTQVDYPNLGTHVYVRYGDLDASEEDICYGDGKHVGTVEQIVNRLLTMLGFVTNRFPDGDRTVVQAPYPLASGTFYMRSPRSGGLIKYSIAFPPGYEYTQCTDGIDNDGDGFRDGFDPNCMDGTGLSEAGDPTITKCSDGIDNDVDGLIDMADPDCVEGDGLSELPMDHPMRNARFPVVFILHGYGQTPDDLQVSAVPFSGFMAQGEWPKVILVFPDGYCGEVEVTQCNDGIDNDEDGLIDSEDPGCAESGGRSESGEFLPYCADGVDNDRDGFVDMEDGGCLTEDWDTEADCIRGNFYVDHVAYPGGIGPGPQYEQRFLDLIEHIDAVYPTRTPETFPEVR